MSDLEKNEINLEEVLNRPEVVEAIRRQADALGSKQVEAFRTNKLPELIQQQVEERLQQIEESKKNKTPDQLKLETLEAELNELKQREANAVRQTKFETNKNKATLLLSEKKLPTTLVDYFVSDDEDQTTERVTKLAEFLEDFKNKSVQEVVKTVQQPTPSNGSLGGDSSGLRKVDELIKAGKHAEAIRLQRQINK